ncbi:MAG: hypothetical protein IJW51_07185 [Clostridia bacterium]|nr:hypothetical protein [Clostridia bacterium]
MKKRYILIISAALLLAGVIALTAWYYTPKRFLRGVSPEEVAAVEVLCGSTGERFTVTDSAEIATLVTGIQAVSLRRDNISQGYKGFIYRLTFFSAEGAVIDTFIMNSSTTVRFDPFFYRCQEDLLPFGYVTELYGKYVPAPAE